MSKKQAMKMTTRKNAKRISLQRKMKVMRIVTSIALKYFILLLLKMLVILTRIQRVPRKIAKNFHLSQKNQQTRITRVPKMRTRKFHLSKKDQ